MSLNTPAAKANLAGNDTIKAAHSALVNAAAASVVLGGGLVTLPSTQGYHNLPVNANLTPSWLSSVLRTLAGR